MLPNSIAVRERYSYPRDACSLSYIATSRRRWQSHEPFSTTAARRRLWKSLN